jgi:FMN phosphatase YigB (HAD superfamily)
MESVKAVFFDAAGTLFRVRGSVGYIYAEVARLPDSVDLLLYERKSFLGYLVIRLEL